MFYYKKMKNEEVIEIGSHSLIVPSDSIEITEEEYETLLAELKAHADLVDEYVQKVRSGEITIDEVPTEYKIEVEERLPQPEEQKYTLDEAAEVLAQEVSQNGYDA